MAAVPAELDLSTAITQAQEKRLFEVSVDLLCVADADGHFRHLSPSWEDTLGWTLEQLMARPFIEFVHPDDLSATTREVDSLLEGNVTDHFENRYLASDGTYRWLSWRSRRSDDGMIYASARDVTQQKLLEEARDTLATVVESAFDAIMALDLYGHVTNVNPAAEAMFGWSREEVVGQHVSLLFPGRDDAYELLARIRTGDVTRYEAMGVRSDGSSLAAWVTVSGIRDHEGSVIGASVFTMDISDRKNAEAEAAQLRVKLEERVVERTRELEQKTRELEASIAELDAFGYSVSHDLRAPLRAMDGFSRILLTDFEASLPDEAVRFLQHIRTNAQGMQKLVDALLGFSRLGRRALEPRLLSPTPLVRQALSDLGVELERAGAVVEIGDLPQCEADPVLLKQVFVNLISNALKFTREIEEPRVEVTSTSRDGAIVYVVRDNGVGFDPQYADKIFGVFQRLHRAEDYEGTGIGLATVERIVTKHGGQIWCEGEPGVGASFYFTLGHSSRGAA